MCAPASDRSILSSMERDVPAEVRVLGSVVVGRFRQCEDCFRALSVVRVVLLGASDASSSDNSDPEASIARSSDTRLIYVRYFLHDSDMNKVSA